MNLWLRLLTVFLTHRRIGGHTVLEDNRLAFRVMPHDLDLLLHMNNGRYLTLMDLGRFALMLRTGLLRELRRAGGIALLGGIVVYYIRPLSLFQRFEIHTRVTSWDEKWIYLEHRITRGDTLHARAIARVLCRDSDGKLGTGQVLEMIGAEVTEPPDPVPAEFARE